jgi:hypothetical protein
MKSLFCVLAIFLSAATAFGQNKPDKTTDQQPLKFPQFNGSKPRIEMPKALKIAAKFIKKEKIDTTNYYLSRVNLIQSGAKDDKQLVWYLRWVKTDGTVGDYTEIAGFYERQRQAIAADVKTKSFTESAEPLPASSEHLPMGSEHLPTTSEPLPTGFELLPTGCAALPMSSALLPINFAALPTSAAVLPMTFEPLPIGCTSLPTGAECLPTGVE